MRICPRCNITPPIDGFGICVGRKEGLQTYCKVCRSAEQSVYRASIKGKAAIRSYTSSQAGKDKSRRAKLKKAYDLSLEDWEALFESQNKTCACCGTDTPSGGRSGWHTDHDHLTGAVCGILCHPCNLGIGHFNDNPDRLLLAYNYTTRTRK